MLHLVRLPLPDVVDYYPLPVTPSRTETDSYRAVNQAFAAGAMEETRGGVCWVHDYQLALVPEALRDAGHSGGIGFFLHTTFPDVALVKRCTDAGGLELFATCLRGMLGADLVGVQTRDDAARLIEAAVTLLSARAGSDYIVLGDGRRVAIRAHPVGIDTEAMVGDARTAELPASVVNLRREGIPLVVALERADYTKGIPERLNAVTEAMASGARFAYAGIASPTRVGLPAYVTLDRAVAAAAEKTQAMAAEHGLPFLNLQQAISWSEVVAMLRDADVVFTSSLADGMNLVPQQAVMAQSERAVAGRGVVLAGRDAGVSQTFAGMEGHGFVAVDPCESDTMTLALQAAVLGKPARISDELVAKVRSLDARRWGQQFLADLEGAHDA